MYSREKGFNMKINTAFNYGVEGFQKSQKL